MTEIDMSVYDATKPSINQYIELLKEFKLGLTNFKCHKIMLASRKKKAFEVLSEQIKGLEGEELKKWKDKLENVFTKKKTYPDFTGYNVGDHVICFTSYKEEGFDGNETCYHNMHVKCKILKINKSSITLVKWNCKMDFSGAEFALANQTVGKIKFKWTNSFGRQTEVVKDLSRITRKCDNLEEYQEYSEESYQHIDYGN